MRPCVHFFLCRIFTSKEVRDCTRKNCAYYQSDLLPVLKRWRKKLFSQYQRSENSELIDEYMFLGGLRLLKYIITHLEKRGKNGE
jgi:hypothetical protein